MEEYKYMTRSGGILKRSANLNLCIGRKKKKPGNIPPKTSTSRTMALTSQLEELANLRTQLQAQHNEMEQARRDLALVRQQQLELAQVREQLIVAQCEKDEVLRILNQRQAAQPIGPAQQDQQQRQFVRDNNVDLRNIISATEFSQVEYRMPKFSDENASHPLEFLEQMEKFYKIKNISVENKMGLIEVALEGNSRLWLNLQRQFETTNNLKMNLQLDFFRFRYK